MHLCPPKGSLDPPRHILAHLCFSCTQPGPTCPHLSPTGQPCPLPQVQGSQGHSMVQPRAQMSDWRECPFLDPTELSCTLTDPLNSAHLNTPKLTCAQRVPTLCSSLVYKLIVAPLSTELLCSSSGSELTNAHATISHVHLGPAEFSFAFLGPWNSPVSPRRWCGTCRAPAVAGPRAAGTADADGARGALLSSRPGQRPELPAPAAHRPPGPEAQYGRGGASGRGEGGASTEATLLPHCRLRPLPQGNFFLNKNMEVKIGDLGLATKIGPGGRCHR